MAILLHNLSARKPALNDAVAVADVLNACEIAENGAPDDYTEERVLADWQRSGFTLESDAWIITTKQAQVVGYADLRPGEDARIELRVRVHPAHRRRGIGTLLLRLAEDQARRLVKRAGSGEAVTLYSSIADTNEAGKHLLEQEGFALADCCWQISIDPAASGSAARQTLELHSDAPSLSSIAACSPRTGIYTARCRAVYEKELRSLETNYAVEALSSAA